MDGLTPPVLASVSVRLAAAAAVALLRIDEGDCRCPL